MNAAGRTLMVVVLYRGAGQASSSLADGSPAMNSETLRCLDALYTESPEAFTGYNVLLWDNSARPLDERELSFPSAYRHAAAEGLGNDGVSGGYNAAMQVCIRDGLAWMLLLDQDTEVTAAYLSGMSRYRLALEADRRIAAVAPLLLEKDFQLSPQQVLRHRSRPVSPGSPRILEDDSFAANSGVLMRVSALQAIRGYSLDFWLDHSDIELFHRFYAAGQRIFAATDLQLQHSMTMLDYDGRMTPERYENFLAAEQAFYDLYRDKRQNAVQLLRLAARVWRQRRYRNPTFSRMTRQFLLRRMMTSKATRLQQWRQRRVTRLAAGSGA